LVLLSIFLLSEITHTQKKKNYRDKLPHETPMSTFLPLSHFIQRSRILSLYRKTLRNVSKQQAMSVEERDHVKRRVTNEYRKHQYLTEQAHIRMCLVQAEQQATFLESGTVASPQLHNSADEIAITHEVVDDASQVDKWTRAGGPDKDDVLGRVGSGWPWG
jgi:hypothetical protein